MEPRYLLGIDAGATNTRYTLYDILTGQTYLLLGGCGNHECLDGGYEEFAALMDAGIRRLCSAAGIQPSDVSSAGLGIAGVDTSRQHKLISGIFQRIGLRHFGLGNDAVLGIKAECISCEGICAVNGTGFSVYGIDAAGKTAQVGGIGAKTGDKGGGSYYAERAIESVYRQIEKRGPQTQMTARAMQLLQVSDPALFVEAVSERMEGPQEGELLRQMSMLLHECAAQQDEVACGVLAESGREYAVCVLSALRKLPTLGRQKDIDVVLVGSCFLRCQCTLTCDTMRKTLAEEMPQTTFHIKPIQTEPAVGGLIWAYELLGVPGAQIPRQKMIESFAAAQKVLPETACAREGNE
ncbi:MAG: BadF/BadG/BcrA/BcrD ATPase family protein [Clostridia bacterium]|nr:BadF/BadG/BcrA/BcrD ATPase family protein [Clostridia bacterium]